MGASQEDSGLDEQEVKGIVALVLEIGVPKDFGAKVKQEDIERVIVKFAELHPSEAYQAGRNLQDQELGKKLALQAGWRLLEKDPYKAYGAGEYAEDEELIGNARSKLLETDPSKAYEVLKNTDDEKLIQVARDRYVEKDPSEAYKMGMRFGDEILAQQALKALSIRNGINPELGQILYRPESH